jgi:hypothetical protein
MIATLIASAASAIISAAVTRHYFPRVVERVVEKFVDRVVEVPVDRVVEKIVEIEKPPVFVPVDRPRFLSAEERRELIASQANDPDIMAQVADSIRRRDESFGGYFPDPAAQIDPNWNPKRKKI